MAINDDLHRYKDVLKKQISHAFRIYLSIAIILSPLYLMNTANAGLIGGWTYTNPISKGASAVISATKNVVINGKDFIKTGTATITPTASQVAKTFGKTAGALALTVAIEQMLGTVDWVMDPENNQITYKPLSELTSLNSATCKTILDKNGLTETWIKNAYPSGYYLQCKDLYYDKNTNKTSTYVCTYTNEKKLYQCRGTYYYTGDLTIPVDNQPKSLPLPNLATRVIDNAKTGEPKAQAAIAESVDQILADAQADPQASAALAREFDESSETKPADEPLDVKIKGKTTNPDGTKTESEFDIPVACDWMPLVCQAASVVITKPQEWAEDIKAAYNDAVDYFKEEPTNKDPEELEIEQPEFEAEQVNLQGSTDCPQDSVSFSLMGKSYTLDMPYQPVCNALDFFRPAVLAVGAITSAYIIAGIRTKEDET